MLLGAGPSSTAVKLARNKRERLTPKQAALRDLKDMLYFVPGFGTGLAANDMYHEPNVLNGLGLALSLLGDAGVVAKGASVTGKDISKAVGKVRKSLANSMGFGNVNENAIRELFPVENIRNQFRQGLPYVRPISQNYDGVRTVGVGPRLTKSIGLAEQTRIPKILSWEDALKPLNPYDVFPNGNGAGWLQQTADRLGINVNHYYNSIITPEELKAINASYLNVPISEDFIQPRYIGSGYPYGLKKAKILMPYDKIREMPMMAKYKDLPEQEFRKVADDLIGSHEFIHWWNQQLRKNINAKRMVAPKGIWEDELTWMGPNQANGMSPEVMGKHKDYFTSSNATETNARTAQLFNAFGLKKGELTPQHINLAKKFYTKVFPNNDMTEFLNAITNKEAFVRWANDHAGIKFGLAPFIGLGVASSIRTASPSDVYRAGGAIHINPANRGKFTATMRRTGKTAEELSHSSNPLTRQRAQFVLNARKWNK